MLTDLEAARRRRENPLWPLSWAVVYRDGTRFAQYGLDGYHYAREIDARRVVRLEVLGHPDSPIPLTPPRLEPPDEVVLRSQVVIARRIHGGVVAQGNGHAPDRASVWRWFGFRYGRVGYLIRIDDDGQIETGVVEPVAPGDR